MSEILIKFKNLNWFFVFMISFLSFVGFVMIYSATYGSESKILISHVYKIILGFVIMIFFGLVEIEFWKKNAYLLYALGLILLIIVSFYGYLGKGARRWIDFYGLNVQPSEIMKIFLIVSLAKFFGILGFLSLIITPYLWGGLKEYQKQRILTLFNPENDPLGSGYHIIQSQIAVGSGGIFGKGWAKGTQSHLDFLPEKHTDFIFSMLGEEFGFFGTLSVVGLICIITYMSYLITSKFIHDNFCRIVGYGIITNFFFAAFINMSMVIGILPIVGLPLPLVSYGGSSMITYFLGFGIILSLERTRKYN